jgi:hypothetical protein
MTIHEMKIDLHRLWDVYTTSTDPLLADAAYDSWCRLVAALEALTRDRKTGRVMRVDETRQIV